MEPGMNEQELKGENIMDKQKSVRCENGYSPN